MIPVLSGAEMREADRRTIEEIGLPGAVLMENAGAAVAAAVEGRFAQARRITILCGRGNNGGDGFVAARRLLGRGPRVILLGRRESVQGDAALHLRALEHCGGQVAEAADETEWARLREGALGADLLVDAVLGTGLREAPAGLPARVIADAAQAVRSAGVPVLAVDVPSGLPSDGGDLRWPVIPATLTVTFAAPKQGHVLPPACDNVGELQVVDIGIPRAVMATRVWLLEEADAAAGWPPREPAAHKGTFGHVLVIGGSVGKTGAVVLAAKGALRAGAGLVTAATTEAALPQVAAGRPECMTEPLPSGPEGTLQPRALDRALELAAARDAVVLGPGLGQEPGARAFARAFAERCPVPLVIDADGLNALAASGAEPAVRAAGPASRPTVLTPHPGEAARLAGGSAADVQSRRLETARALAAAQGSVVVLKGQRSLVAAPDGKTAVNPTGNPGMATGGTGDVLAGVVGALLARGRDAWTAATAAAYVHGRAGDRAADDRGQEAMLAGDLADAVGTVLHALEVGHR